MKPAFLSFLFIFTFLTGFTQTIRQMVVYDALSLKPIPYVTVKVMHSADGTYADETGKFEVKASDIDSLLITCVGYQSKIVNTQRDTIHLEPIVVHLREVKVTPIKMKEQLVGLYKSKAGTKYFFGGSLNFELVLKISIPEKYPSYRIKGVKLDARNTKAKSLGRLHIYSQNKDGFPDKELLTEDIIINQTIRTNYEIDLSRFNLILNDRVLFVGIEAIQANVSYKPNSGDCIGFGLTFDKNEPFTYSRTLRDPEYLWRLNFSQSFSKDPSNKTKNPGNLMVSLILD